MKRQCRAGGVFLAFAFVIAVALAGASAQSSLTADEESAAVGLFERPALHAESLALEQLIDDGQYERAELTIRQRLLRYGTSPVHHALLAAALAGKGRAELALNSLEKAVSLGLSARTAERLQSHFASLAGSERYIDLINRIGNAAAGDDPASGITPYQVAGQTALVGTGNTIWDPEASVLRTYFQFDDVKPEGKAVQAASDRAASRLNALFAAKSAAGNSGDLYDNRDTDHSTLQRADYPQLSFVEYGEEAIRARINFGVNPGLLYNAVTFGNSSMAVTGGPFWRSQPRLALTRPGGGERLFAEYAGNALYIYPEHQDHDADNGDLIPANTPFLLMSQGSSGSDQPLMRAVATILAAFKPQVKAFLQSNNLVMPTVQMIFRRGQAGISGDARYLSGAAHPSVFDAGTINLPEMIERANQLNIADVPPMVRLSVLKESAITPGLDAFGVANETLFDTPGSIARIARSTAYKRSLRISAADTRNPNGRKLTFHWVVLRGDATRISIAPQTADASIVDLTVPWHEGKPVPGRPDLLSQRVDIGVFVHNGVHYSAPSFVSFFFPANQWREYNDDGSIRFVDYYASKYSARYADPLLFPARDWSDRYDYDVSGNLIGWTRQRAAGKTRFTRHGARVTQTDRLGRPVEAIRLRYLLQTDANGLNFVAERETGERLRYIYAADDDALGQIAE